MSLNCWEYKITETLLGFHFSKWCVPSRFQRKAANAATKGSINSQVVPIAIIVLQTTAEWLILLQKHWRNHWFRRIRTASHWLTWQYKTLKATQCGWRVRKQITKNQLWEPPEIVLGDSCRCHSSWIEVETSCKTVPTYSGCFQDVINLVIRKDILKRSKLPSHFKIQEVVTATRSINWGFIYLKKTNIFHP